LYEKLQLDAVA
jgi:hypothetical protein